MLTDAVMREANLQWAQQKHSAVRPKTLVLSPGASQFPDLLAPISNFMGHLCSLCSFSGRLCIGVSRAQMDLAGVRCRTPPIFAMTVVCVKVEHSYQKSTGRPYHSQRGLVLCERCEPNSPICPIRQNFVTGLQPASSSSSDALQLVAMAQQQRCFSARCWPATPWSMAQQKHFPLLTLLPTPADEASHLLPNSRGRQNGVQRSV